MTVLIAHGDEMILAVTCGFLLVLSFVPGLRLMRRSLVFGLITLVLSALLLAAGNTVTRNAHLSANADNVLARAAAICWWVAGGAVCSAALHYVVNRWIFPDQEQPRSRKLFADLSAGLIYLAAGIGILNVLVGPSLPGMLATSGVAAVVLGLALQSTLGDLFSGLALNFERPFGAGEWISIQNGPEGKIIEINWRAARLLTAKDDIVIIPNSTLAKAVVINRSRPNLHHVVTLSLTFPQTVSPNTINAIVQSAAADVPNVLHALAFTLRMQNIGDLGIVYELDFCVTDYALSFSAKSEILRHIWFKAKDAGVAFPTITALENRLVAQLEAQRGQTTGQDARRVDPPGIPQWH